MSAYYNEHEPYAAQWLRNLIAAGHLPAGDVDERDIQDVRADDIGKYRQAHFFAGIGGWPHALRLAGWPDDRFIWTGSCPCQPFSAAGKGTSADDERHLWPAWFALIRELRPATIAGEQVEAAIGWGWLDAVFADLEAEGYACTSTVLPACGVGAPHVRQRLWFVADADAPGRGEQRLGGLYDGERAAQRDDADRRGALGMVDAAVEQATPTHRDDRMANARTYAERGGGTNGEPAEQSGPADFWGAVEWLDCIDGKRRPAQPGIFPLAHGTTARMAKLRAIGNAICAPLAAEFVASFMEARP